MGSRISSRTRASAIPRRAISCRLWRDALEHLRQVPVRGDDYRGGRALPVALDGDVLEKPLSVSASLDDDSFALLEVARVHHALRAPCNRPVAVSHYDAHLMRAWTRYL